MYVRPRTVNGVAASSKASCDTHTLLGHEEEFKGEVSRQHSKETQKDGVLAQVCAVNKIQISGEPLLHKLFVGGFCENPAETLFPS